MPDNYYRCLVLMPAARLLKMLELMEGSTDEWFKSHLRDDEEDDTDEPRVEDAALLPDADHSISVPVVQNNLWQRCLVDTGEATTEIKVYFDGCSSGPAAGQRGWTDCGLHGCRRYRSTDAFESMLQFCTYMYLFRCCGEAVAMTRDEHYEHEAADIDVAAVMRMVRLRSF